MKVTKLTLITLFCVLILILTYSHRIYLFQTFYFAEIGDRIFVSKGTPVSMYQIVLKVVDAAYKRNVLFFKKNYPPVDIYFLYDSLAIRKFSKFDTYATHKSTPLKSWIVVNNDGLNIDIISHEIAHNRIYQILGPFRWIKQKRSLQIWIDEGIALQLDNRNEFKLDNFQYDTNIQRNISKLTLRNTNFYDPITIKENYASAKYTVQRILEKQSIEDLLDLSSKK